MAEYLFFGRNVGLLSWFAFHGEDFFHILVRTLYLVVVNYLAVLHRYLYLNTNTTVPLFGAKRNAPFCRNALFVDYFLKSSDRG